MARPPALILGSGVTALGALRGFAQLGIPAYVAGDGGHYVADSRHYRPVPGPRGLDPHRGLAAFLDRLPFDRAVLVPCTDHWAMEVSRLDAKTRERFPASVPSPDVLTTLVDKAPFSTLLREERLPHPRTWTLSDPADLEHAPDDVFDHAFLKPTDSQSFFARYGVKAFRVASRQDAAERWGGLHRDGFEMLLQEYVPGPSSSHFFVDGFVDGRGEVRALFGRRRLRMYPPDFGNSSCVVTVPLSDLAQAVATVERIVARLGYRGIFSAEFKRDERDDQYRILEVNARPWWYIEFAARCGVDMCDLFYRDALRVPLPAFPTYAPGKVLVYPYYDFFACRMQRRAGTLSLAEWARSWIGSVQPIFRLDDPWPAVREGMARLGSRAAKGWSTTAGRP